MLKISTLEELIDCFEDTDCAKQIGVLKNLDIPIEEFRKHAVWKKDCYIRVCIARRDEFEFILLCWDKGAKTPIHDHNGQDCWVYQVEGSAVETRFDVEDTEFSNPEEINLEEGKLTYMHDRMGFHSIENRSNSKAMTLHIYANPIDECKVFNEEANCFETKEMQYDAVLEEISFK